MEKKLPEEKICPLRVSADCVHNDRIIDLGWMPFIACLKERCMWYTFCTNMNRTEYAKEIKL